MVSQYADLVLSLSDKNFGATTRSILCTSVHLHHYLNLHRVLCLAVKATKYTLPENLTENESLTHKRVYDSFSLMAISKSCDLCKLLQNLSVWLHVNFVSEKTFVTTLGHDLP